MPALAAFDQPTSQPVGMGARAPKELADKDKEFLPVEDLRKKRNDYLTAKAAEIEEQKEGRRYYHGAHWTAAEIEILRRRRQPIVTYNRIGRKINGIVGLVERQRQDPKAFPRTPEHEEGAEVATASVRYVLDANDWKTKESECALRAACEGIAGVELNLIEGDHGDPDISISGVDGENFFYDVKSVRPDFSDARYMGIAKWLELDEAIDLFPEKEDELTGLVDSSGGDMSSASDRENRFAWLSGKRMLLVDHWYKHKGRWCWAFYVGTTLLDEGESPFFDERNKSMSRFVMFSAAVDQDGDRYGFPRNLKGPQDEINQRRSKALWMSVSRQIKASKGAVDDVETARRELMRPDGIIEYNAAGQFDLIDQKGDVAAQFQFMQDAKEEIQNFANVDAAAMTGVGKNLSGTAINLLQQPGMAELGPFINAFRGWKIRIYRAIWCMAQRHWKSERWIRVTDDDQIAKFMQINGMDIDQQSGEPILVNALGNLDVDIIMDEGPDVVSMMTDVYDQVAQDPSIPFLVKLEFMNIPGSKKRQIQGMLQPPQPTPADLEAKQVAMDDARAAVDVLKATAIGKRASAVQAIATAAANAAKAALPTDAVWATGMQDAPLPPLGAQGQQTAMPGQIGGQIGGQPMQPGQPPIDPASVPQMPPAPSGANSGGDLASLAHQHLGARRAPDGKLYVPDPGRPGRYMVVA